MNLLETLLTQAQEEAKKIQSEYYHKGFKASEGTANELQKELNHVQDILLLALGRERGRMEVALDTAQDIVDVFNRTEAAVYRNVTSCGCHNRKGSSEH
jgi:pyrrolidone-carboxylate peptidase